MRTLLFILIAAMLAMQFSGCTVVGIVAGASVDHRNARDHRVSWDGARSVPRGRDVEVALTSGDTLRGKFTGMRSLPADSYRAVYDSVSFLLGGDSGLPHLGEAVLVTPVINPRVRGTFRGFEAEALAVRPADENSNAYFPLSQTVHLRHHDGQPFDLDQMRILVASRELPSTREFTVQSAAQTYRVPLEHIQEVYAPPHPTRYWIVGGLIGLALDAVFVAVIVPRLDSDFSDGSDWDIDFGIPPHD